MTGYERDANVDEVSRKEFLRKNRRRPVDEIVNELGEGRGMHWTTEDAWRDSGNAVLTSAQASPLPATRSAGHSASRPTTALMCRSLLQHKYVTYTHTNTIFHVHARPAFHLSAIDFSLRRLEWSI